MCHTGVLTPGLLIICGGREEVVPFSTQIKQSASLEKKIDDLDTAFCCSLNLVPCSAIKQQGMPWSHRSRSQEEHVSDSTSRTPIGLRTGIFNVR